jgi:hypothetical protein
MDKALDHALLASWQQTHQSTVTTLTLRIQELETKLHEADELILKYREILQSLLHSTSVKTEDKPQQLPCQPQTVPLLQNNNLYQSSTVPKTLQLYEVGDPILLAESHHSKDLQPERLLALEPLECESEVEVAQHEPRLGVSTPPATSRALHDPSLVSDSVSPLSGGEASDAVLDPKGVNARVAPLALSPNQTVFKRKAETAPSEAINKTWKRNKIAADPLGSVKKVLKTRQVKKLLDEYKIRCPQTEDEYPDLVIGQHIWQTAVRCLRESPGGFITDSDVIQAGGYLLEAEVRRPYLTRETMEHFLQWDFGPCEAETPYLPVRPAKELAHPSFGWFIMMPEWLVTQLREEVLASP